jgi:hypothetical protein
LCIDPELDTNPLPRDAEGKLQASAFVYHSSPFHPHYVSTFFNNFPFTHDTEMIDIEHNVSMEQLDEIILRGDLSLTGTQTVVMAKAWLQKSGLL